VHGFVRGVVWCASPSLVGWRVWGRPDEAETRTLLQSLAQYPKISSRFDVIADTRGVEYLNAPAVALLVRWVLRHRHELRRRVRMQANVIHRDSIGCLLVGIVASVSEHFPLRTFGEPLEAFRTVLGGEGTALCEEVEAIVAQVRASPHELQVVRALLATNVAARVEEAAKALATSSRSLQRILQQYGTSFHAEQTDARFALAKSLLEADGMSKPYAARSASWRQSPEIWRQLLAAIAVVLFAAAGVVRAFPFRWRDRPAHATPARFSSCYTSAP
jgi:AraC-like DNA-binding protein